MIVVRTSAVGLCLGLLLGCTQHGDPAAAADEQPPSMVRTPPVDAPQIIQPEPTIEETPAEPMIVGPVTSLSCKPLVGALGQLNADARPDLVVLCHSLAGASLLVLIGAPDGSFIERAPVPVHGSGLALGDLDADGDLDLLLLDGGGAPAYQVGHNDGAGNFELLARRSIPGHYGGELRGASLADLDDDGKLDVVVPLWDTIRVMSGRGDGRFTPGRALKVGRDPYDTALGDLDGDGRLDLVATAQAARPRNPDHYDASGAAVWIWRGESRGFAKQPSTIEVSGAKQVELADLDGDNHLEIVVSGAGGLTVIRDPLGEHSFARMLVGTDGTLLVADVIDSPTPELITTSYIQSRTHLISVPLAQLTATAGQPVEFDKLSLEAGSYAVGVFAADLDGDDGRADVVLLNAGPPSNGYGLGPSVELLLAH